MVLALSIALFVTVCLLGWACMRLLRQKWQHAVALEEARSSARESGRAYERGELGSLMRWAVQYSFYRTDLLAQSDSKLPVKWQKAFALLLPPQIGGKAPDPNEGTLEEQLIKLGFIDGKAGLLVRAKEKYPLVLIMLLVTLLSGASEDTAWGVAAGVHR